MSHSRRVIDACVKLLREFGLRYPGAHTKSPWPGHLDLAVRDKTFTYLTPEGTPFQISCKLPQSALAALTLPFVEPTRYGLGKSGWVTAHLPDEAPPPTELFKAWIDESYRAQAPKTLVRELSERGEDAARKGGSNTSTRAAKGKRTAASKTTRAATAKVASTATRGPAKTRAAGPKRARAAVAKRASKQRDA